MYGSGVKIGMRKNFIVIVPKGPRGGEARVLRGGSWYDTAQLCRVSYRSMNRPDESRVNIGFRIVMSK